MTKYNLFPEKLTPSLEETLKREPNLLLENGLMEEAYIGNMRQKIAKKVENGVTMAYIGSVAVSGVLGLGIGELLSEYLDTRYRILIDSILSGSFAAFTFYYKPLAFSISTCFGIYLGNRERKKLLSNVPGNLREIVDQRLPR